MKLGNENLDSTAKPAAAPRLRFGDRLVASGVITPAQLAVALEEQKRTQEPVGQILENLGFVRDEDLVRLVAEDLGIPFVKIRDLKTDPALCAGIDPDFLSAHSMVPLAEERGLITVAMAKPSDLQSIDQLQRHLKKPLRVVAATNSDIRAYLSAIHSSTASKSVGINEVGEVANQVDAILSRAIRDRATDIHVEPDERLLRIRFRVDGVLRAVDSLPVTSGQSFSARVKVLAGMDLAEHRRPQDGRFQHVINSRTFDFRTSVMPTRHGENIVLRILERNGGTARVEQLGIPAAIRERIESIASLPHGLFLVTGPTGSGKTTTLYATLRTIDALTRKVTSIEDPIEAEIPLARQSQVDPTIGYGFAEGLRSMLRQDPDVILLGEIRDRETAEIAMRASLTGHLVFATLHANDAVAAAPRMIDMGIEPFLINTSLIGVLAQRLVRVLCPECKIESDPEEPDSLLFRGSPPKSVHRAVGCPKCAGTGYFGRVGIYELFLPDAHCRKLILSGCDDAALRAAAADSEFTAMSADGREKVIAGITTSTEILRVTSA